jgi:hypothetical protein
VNSKLLLDDKLSCFQHPIPTFKGEKLLEKASKNKDLNIEKVRDGFTDSFISSMREVWRADARDMSFELGEVEALKDISQDVKDAIEETEREWDESGDEEE